MLFIVIAKCAIGSSFYPVKTSVASIHRKYQFDIDISYRIVSPAEISKISIYRYQVLICYLAELPLIHLFILSSV